MGKWTGLEHEITQELADAEPEAERLFSQAPRRESSHANVPTVPSTKILRRATVTKRPQARH